MLQVKNTFLDIENPDLTPTSEFTRSYSDPQFHTYFVDGVDDDDIDLFEEIAPDDFEEPACACPSVAETTQDEDENTSPVETLSSRSSSYETVATTRAEFSYQSAAVGVTEQINQQVYECQFENTSFQRQADCLFRDCQGLRRAGGEEAARAGPRCFAVSFAGQVMRTIPMQDARVPDNCYEQNATQPRMADSEDQGTTVVLRNLPNNYSSLMLSEMLRSQGFSGYYNFLYLPIDFTTGACLGYAFINLISSADVPHFWQTFEGFNQWVVPTKKKCYVTWSSQHQGLQANVERYRNSPVMHESVPEEFKPRLLVNGKDVPFPRPTRKIRRPHLT